ILYGTGFGATSPGVASGSPPGFGARVVAPVAVTVGGAVGAILYAGLAPDRISVYQINLNVGSTQGGDLPVVVNVGGVNSPPVVLPVVIPRPQGQTPTIQTIQNRASL